MDTIDTGAEDPSKLEAARKEAEKAKNLQTLFKGTKNPHDGYLKALNYGEKFVKFGHVCQ